jgi:hypothetical protein
MKNFLLAFALIFFFIASAAKAQSYIEKAATEERLYKWDGQFLMTSNTGVRLLKIDGKIPTAIMIALATGLI